ncbi:hypothetical protein ACHAPT_004185 [Fusarium lateritium]
MEPKKESRGLIGGFTRLFRRKPKDPDPNSAEAGPSSRANVVFDAPPGSIRLSQFMTAIPLTAETSYIEPIEWVHDVPNTYPSSVSDRNLTSKALEVRWRLQQAAGVDETWNENEPWALRNNIDLVKHDLGHCKYTMLLDNKLHLSPIPKYPTGILDLGTGTGIWAVDMAEMYPSARIIGVDLFPLQTKQVPPNVRFHNDNIECTWHWGENVFDFIHGRELTMTIYDWPKLIQEAYRSLKPGGYFEVSGFVPDFRSDDGTLPKDSFYGRMSKIFFEMAERRDVSG